MDAFRRRPRAAAAPEPFAVRLVTSDDPNAPAFLAAHDDSGDDVGVGPAGATDLEQRILAELASSAEPRSREALRAALAVRNERLGVALRKLEADGRAQRSSQGWSSAGDSLPTP